METIWTRLLELGQEDPERQEEAITAFARLMRARGVTASALVSAQPSLQPLLDQVRAERRERMSESFFEEGGR